VVVVVAVVLGGLAYYGSDAGTGCSADDGALQAAAEECAERGPAGYTDEGSLAGSDAVIAAVIVVVRAVVVVVVAATLSAVAHAVVVGVVLVLILRGWKKRRRKEHRRDEDRFS